MNNRKTHVTKYSTIKPTVCRTCYCTYQGTHKDLYRKNPWETAGIITDVLYIKCPVCGMGNIVNFEEEYKK